jgi:hypothetical protein
MPTTTDTRPTDPGPDLASERASDVDSAAAAPLEVDGKGHIRIGTASWTDPTMTAGGVFYPSSASNAEERLLLQAKSSGKGLLETEDELHALREKSLAQLGDFIARERERVALSKDPADLQHLDDLVLKYQQLQAQSIRASCVSTPRPTRSARRSRAASTVRARPARS